MLLILCVKYFYNRLIGYRAYAVALKFNIKFIMRYAIEGFTEINICYSERALCTGG